MRNKILTMVSVLSITLLSGGTCFADNPIVQTIYTADPAPILYNDTVFLFTGHDEDGPHGFFDMRDWRLFTTTDMVNWTDRGVMMSLKTFSWSHVDAWAGQVVTRNNKFYYYVPIRNAGDNFDIGVGVSDKLVGPFTDAIGKPLFTTSFNIDPTVFTDDDGQAYLYCGNPNPKMVKLNSDMISTSGNITQLSQSGFKNTYLEGPWFYKRNGMYYLLFSTSGAGNEGISYSTSTGPTGPWTYRGIIQPVQTPQTSWTNHSGVIDYKGNSYFFYHTGNLPGGDHVHRSTCVEQFKYNADGTIPAIPQTKTGAPQIGHLNPYDTIQAETICWSVGLKTGICGEGGLDVDSIHNGDYIKVKGVDFGSGAKSFDARVASGTTNGGSIELHLDTTTGPLAGTCSVAGTGGWQTWTTKSCTVTGATGVHDLYLKFTGSSGKLFTFNWWKFAPAVGTGSSTLETKGARGNPINLVANEGKLRLDFSQTASQAKVHICLFDLTGRLATTLFAGRLSSAHLTLPLDRAKIRTGAYVIRVTMDDEIALIKTLSLQGK